jgi:uncharacterized caspase-like protein
MRYVLALLWVLAGVSICAEARAEKQIALVIGNGAYQNTAPLPNPSHDAADMAAALKRLGFDVMEGRDLDKRTMERLIRQFGVKLAGADVALFFYAGHGLQIEGQNYLVPTDARLASQGDIDFEGLALNLVIKQMEREAKTSLVLLDACRDNPLARNLARTMGTRGGQIGQGLAEVRTSVGTLIAFSTQPGNFALDGAGRNSPYTEALLKHVEVPGKDVSGVLVDVRNDVLKATGGRQVPWEHTSLRGQLYLNKAAMPDRGAVAPTQIAPAATVASPKATGGYDPDLEIALWNSVKDSKSPAMIEAYLERYPSGTFAGLARIMVAGLKEPAANVPELRVKTPEPPAKAQASPTKTQEPARVAALLAPEVKAPPMTDPEVLARALQTELKRVGCDPGKIDGKWGGKAKEALTEFARHIKVAMPAEEPTAVALEAVTSRKERVCPLECDRGETEVNGKCVAKATKAKKPQTAEPARRQQPSSGRSRAAEEGSSGSAPVGGSISIGIGRRGGGIGIGF